MYPSNCLIFSSLYPEIRLHGLEKRFLRLVLPPESGKDTLVDCPRCDEVDDHRGLFFLPLSPEPRHRLLIKLKAPGNGEPEKGASAALEIESVSR